MLRVKPRDVSLAGVVSRPAFVVVSSERDSHELMRLDEDHIVSLCSLQEVHVEHLLGRYSQREMPF